MTFPDYDAAESVHQLFHDYTHAPDAMLFIRDIVEAALGDRVLWEPKQGKYIGGSMENVLGNLSVAENDGDVAEVLDALEHWEQVWPKEDDE